MSLHMLDQDSFDVFEYIETLAWNCKGGTSDPTKFDPVLLQSSFEKHIADLKEIKQNMTREVSRYETECNEDEKRHWAVVSELQKSNQSGLESIEKLDKSINFVATRVVHLGGQLQEVQTPRARAVEAKKLTVIFNELMHTIDPLNDQLTKAANCADSNELHAAAQTILKLDLISQDLPSDDEKFTVAGERIGTRYRHIEAALLSEFRGAYSSGDARTMRRCAGALSQFRGYQGCVDAFVGDSLRLVDADAPLRDSPSAVARIRRLAADVFDKADKIVERYVKDIYTKKLEVYVNKKLEETTRHEQNLFELYSLHCKTAELGDRLITDDHLSSHLVSKLGEAVFREHVGRYAQKECSYVAKWCSSTLERYYDDLRHIKKTIQSGGMNILKRELQATLKSNIENYGGETFLSHDLAIGILLTSKQSYDRCKQLSAPDELADNAMKIFSIVLQQLVVDHCEYAIDLGLQAVPYAENRSEPQIFFFKVISNTNTIVHLFEKQFSDSLLPLLTSDPVIINDCICKKSIVMKSIEVKLDLGLERCVAAIAGWVKTLLNTKQNKSDFMPTGSDILASSPACRMVSKYLANTEKQIRYSLDGQNLTNFLMVLGRIVHHIVVEHILSFQYNQTGSMLVICDVNEYRQAIHSFDSKSVTAAFDKLHSLCNLLLMMPGNLETILAGYDLQNIDGTTIHDFLKMREDYKTIDIASLRPYLTNNRNNGKQQSKNHDSLK